MADAAADTTESKSGDSDVGEEKSTSLDAEPHTSEQNRDETSELEVKSTEHDSRLEADKADLKEVHTGETSIKIKEAGETKTDTEDASNKVEVEVQESDTVEEKSKEISCDAEPHTSEQNQDEPKELEVKSIEHDSKLEENKAELKEVHADETSTKIKEDIEDVSNKMEVEVKVSDTMEGKSKETDIEETERNEIDVKVAEETDGRDALSNESDSKDVPEEKNTTELKTHEADTEDAKENFEEVNFNETKVDEEVESEENTISDSKLFGPNIKEIAAAEVELNLLEPNDVADDKELNPDVAAEPGALDILKLPGTDEIKFQKLSELMSAGEMSNEDFVNSVLSLVVGKQFDLDSNFILTNGENVLRMVDLIDSCPAKLQAELWSLFIAGVRRCTVNLQTCVGVGLAEKILARIPSYDDMLADIMMELLSIMGSYSISVKELQMMFSHLQARNGKWPRHSTKLLKVLHQMPLQSGPNEFFSFPGLKGSVIALPPLSKWPQQVGWTFHCWLRLDPDMGVINNRDKPYIFCFRTGKGVGYSGHFFGNAFVITVIKTKGKGFQHCVRYDFQPREWNMVTIAFIYNRWTTSELNCYVNGNLVSRAEMSWPVNTNDVFDKCYLGSSAEMEKDAMFCGQMSSVYLFSEALSAQQVEALYMLGPGHSSQMKFESTVALNETMKKVLYDGKLSSSIVFLYSPVACDGQLCLDSSPKGNQSYFMHSPHALILGETKPCITHSIYSSLHSIGGIQVFFPLFEQLDLVEEMEPGLPEKINYTICTSLVRLLCKLLFGSGDIQQQLLQYKGFLVIGYLLEKSSKEHLTTEVLDGFASMATCLLANPSSGLTLLKHLFDCILLNPSLWINASMEVQRNLYSILLNFLNEPDNPVIAYRVSYIVQTIHKLMYFYWVVKPMDQTKFIPKGVDGPRPEKDDILELRNLMLQSIKLLVKTDSKIEDEELQSIISYLITVHEDENLIDVLEMLVQLMSEVPASLVPAFDRAGGIKVVFKLLTSSDERICVEALKLLGYFLARSMHKRKNDAMGPHNLYTLITERLAQHPFPITMEIYNILFAILTERMTVGWAVEDRPTPDLSFKIENPLMLKVIAYLIHQSKQRPLLMEVKKLYLSDLTALLANNRENRRTILQMSVWQEWLLSLAYFHPRNDKEQSVTDGVMNIFGLLLFHAVKLEVGGWRVWIDTQAILHSKVSLEEFRIRTVQMHRQFSKKSESGSDRSPQRQGTSAGSTAPLGDRSGQLATETEVKKEAPIVTSSEQSKAVNDQALHNNKDEKDTSKVENDGFASDVADRAIVRSTKDPDKRAEASIVEQKHEGLAPSNEKEQIQLTPTTKPLANDASGRQTFSPTPRAPAFTIPEFRWSALHVKLLADLFSLFEKEMEGWKIHTSKTVLDFVNSPENHVFASNLTQVVSQLSDNLISSCGGLLPLLAAATSSMNELEGSESGHGLSVMEASAFLQRVINMADILVFASNINLGSLEQEKMMNVGGVLRQSLRLVCTGAVRSCLDCRIRHFLQLNGDEGVDKVDRKLLDFIAGTYSAVGSGASANAVNVLSLLGKELTGPVRDPEKLIQDMDVNRLRAVIYRNIDETKQAEFLALTIVYFVSVLMVSKYRDILEPLPGSSSRLSRSSSTSSRNEEEQKRVQSSGSAPVAKTTVAMAPTTEQDEASKTEKELGENALQSKAKSVDDEGDKSAEDTGKDAKDSLSEQTSPSSTSEEANEASVEPDTSVNIGSQTADESASSNKTTGGQEVASISTADRSDADPSSAAGDQPNHQPLTQDSLPKSFEVRASTAQGDSRKLTERLERVLGSLSPLVREIFVDFAPFLSRTLLGSHGQELVPGGMVTLKQSTSVVELVMLLCSQEWQNSLQKFAGLAFVELVNEGRLSSAATHDHIVRVANEAEFILKRLRADDIQKHSEFQNLCKRVFYERSEEMKLCDHLITSSHVRDQIVASNQCEKVRNILAVGREARTTAHDGVQVDYWKLDKWEDDSRRKRRLVRNTIGTSHADAVYRAVDRDAGGKSDAVDPGSFKYDEAFDRMPRMPSPDSIADDEVMQTEERDGDDLAGVVALSTPCKLIVPGTVIRGTMSITKTELHFEISSDDARNKAISPQVLQYVEYLHSKWSFRDIRAIFSRKYRLQNAAIEIFVASRTSVMFAFDDFAVMKRVVGALPQVGIGVKYGLPQTRRVSLASPRQIYKMSNMTKRWQQQEVSNFDYLMFLNTVAGRTYSDLSQYPIYPWVIANYDSPDLDLGLAANYRDFSKPVGALNPTRREFFEERYASLAVKDTPARHYDTHYSTARSTADWLVRLEPFTTFFLDQNRGKFSDPNKMFHSVAQSWRNCFLDASDVRELVPEFFYLPEMFVNMNSLDLGVSSEGQNISEVELPPWAKTPEEFVRIMRMALESEIVSTQLNQWIDLIFGYRQRGPEAVRALNVFHHLTYEGSINWQAINDSTAKQALEDQIFHLGQTPSQLLTEPHPPRHAGVSLMSPLMSSVVREDVCMIMKFLSNSPVVHVSAHTHPSVPVPAVITITTSYNFAVNKWDHIGASSPGVLPSYTEGSQLPLQLPLAMDPLLGLNRRSLGDEHFDQRIMAKHSTFVATADNRFILAAGFIDKSFRVFSTESGKVCQIVFGHYDLVTCICRSECGINQDCYIVTGSRDCTVMVWHWTARQQVISGDSTNPTLAASKATLVGHQTEVTCVLVSSELGIIISGSKGGSVLMHCISGELVRSLSPLSSVCQSPKLLALSREGHLFVCYEKGGVCSFGINGKPVGHLPHDDNIQAMILSRDGQFVILGGHSGAVGVWRSFDLNALYTYPACDSPIQSLALSHDQRYLMAGLATGCLIVFHIDFTKWLQDFQKLSRP